MKSFLFLVVCAAVLCGATVFAQSSQLVSVLSTAETQQKQGKLIEAYETLTAAKPTASEESSAELLKYYYDEEDDDLQGNEYYLKDKALEKLVKAFLDNRQSDNAVITAQSIANRWFRNAVLFDILQRQCRAAALKPEEFDLMIGKADKTALLLTDYYRDDGYAKIAERYLGGNQFHSAVATMKKIDDAKRRDKALLQTAWRGKHCQPDQAAENEKRLYELADLVQSPLVKAQVLQIIADQYPLSAKITSETKAEYQRKRLVALEKATELLLPLPDHEEKVQQLTYVYRAHLNDCREDDAETVRKDALASAEKVKDDYVRFRLYTGLFRYGQTDSVELLEKMKRIAENATDSIHRAVYRESLWNIEQNSPLPSKARRKETFEKAMQAVLDDDIQRMTRLSWLLDNTEDEETDVLADKITEIVFSSDNERNGHARSLMESVVRKLMKQGKTDRALEIVFSPKLPKEWKSPFCSLAGYELLGDSKTSEFREADFKKLVDAVESPQEKFHLHYVAVQRQKLHTPEDWAKRVELALTIPNPQGRFYACQQLLWWVGSTYRDVSWKNGKDYLPTLIGAMEKVAEAETNLSDKVVFYGETLIYVHQYKLWDEKKIVDWRKQYDADFVRVPPGKFRFDRLRRMQDAEPTPSDDAAKNARIDQLLVVAREIPAQNYRHRIDALLSIAQQARDGKLTDRAREIAAEGLEYGTTIPGGIRRRETSISSSLQILGEIHGKSEGEGGVRK